MSFTHFFFCALQASAEWKASSASSMGRVTTSAQPLVYGYNHKGGTYSRLDPGEAGHMAYKPEGLAFRMGTTRGSIVGYSFGKGNTFV